MSRAADLRLLERTGALFAQLFFIAAGVYLGNQADDWKQEREHRAAARSALQNFRTELATNRARVVTRMPYHKALHDSANAMMRRPAATFGEAIPRLGFQGMRTVSFSSTAWDLALTTQSLTYLEPRLAFAIADVYNQQRAYAGMQDQFMSGTFTPGTFAMKDPMPLVVAMSTFLGDAAVQEPLLVSMYDRTLPRLDSAPAATPR